MKVLKYVQKVQTKSQKKQEVSRKIFNKIIWIYNRTIWDTDGHFAHIHRVKSCTTDDHLKTFTVWRHLRYLLVNTSY